MSAITSAHAPNPAGAPLLSDSESRFISSFFDNVQSDQYTNYGEGLAFSDAWYDLPPQFMGSTTSYGQQPSAPLVVPTDGMNTFPIDLNFNNPSVLMPPPPHPSLHGGPTHVSPQHTPPTRETPSEDVLAAATLLQNGAGAGRMPHGSFFQHEQNYYPAGSMPPPQITHGRPSQAITGYTTTVTGPRPHPDDDPRQHEHAHTIADMVFGSALQDPAAARLAAPPVDMRWGSDSSFSGGARTFVPRSERETSESLSREQMKLLDSLEVAGSAGDAGPSSPPVANGRLSSPGVAPSSRRRSGPEAADGAKPRRRRKAAAAKEDVLEDDELDLSQSGPPILKTASRKRGSVHAAAAASLPEDEAQHPAPKRRRKSNNNGGGGGSNNNANGAKAQRENLTEEQKRENHIRSEQKRRSQIKEGFENLCLLVPSLDGNGFSKSAVLKVSGEWLEQLLAEIDELRSQLEDD